MLLGMGKGKNFRDMTPEEHRAISAKGGRNCGKARRERAAQAKAMSAIALDIIDGEASPAVATQWLSMFNFSAEEAKGATNGTLMVARLAEKAMNGDARAFEQLHGLEMAERGRQEQERPEWCHDFAVSIGPDFLAAHRLLCNVGTLEHVRDYWCRGGRGSLKSSWISLEIGGILMRDPEANAVIMQAHAANLRDGTFAQMQWAFEELGVSELWAGTTNPCRFRNVETGQLVVFRGCDDPKKLKSIKFAHGSCKAMWLEEVDLFRGMEEVRSIRQSVTRGSECRRFYSFNPPRSADNWANRECDRVACSDNATEVVVESCYTHAPAEWLGEGFIADAEALKETDELAYRHEYLGEAVGVGGAVFPNAKYEPISELQIANFDRICAGQDFGWWPDPWACVVSAWEPGTRTLYSFAERGGNKLQPEDMAASVMDALTWRDPDGRGGLEPEPCGHRATVWSDDADPGRIEAMRDCGVDAQPSGKGGKRMASYEWLAGVRWVIDEARCPNLAREVRGMSYERTAAGEWLNAVPDGNDHWVDAARYSVMPIVRSRHAYGSDREKPKYKSPLRQNGGRR